MIEKIPFTTTKAEYQGKSFDVQEHASPYDIQEKVNEIIDWINDVCALNVTDKQVTANIPNIDAGELAYLQKENSDLKDEVELLQKKLEIAVDALKLMYMGNGDPQDIMRYIDNRWTPVRRLCKQTLEQITALEQKDK